MSQQMGSCSIACQCQFTSAAQAPQGARVRTQNVGAAAMMARAGHFCLFNLKYLTTKCNPLHAGSMQSKPLPEAAQLSTAKLRLGAELGISQVKIIVAEMLLPASCMLRCEGCGLLLRTC